MTGGGCGLDASGSGHTLTSSVFSGNTRGVAFGDPSLEATRNAIGCTFSDNDEEGFSLRGGFDTLAGCSVTGNRGHGCASIQGILSLAGAKVSGNSHPAHGGGVAVSGLTDYGLLAISGSTLVTGNTAPQGAGIASINSLVAGATTSNIYANTGADQCASSRDRTTWTPVANCAFERRLPAARPRRPLAGNGGAGSGAFPVPVPAGPTAPRAGGLLSVVVFTCHGLACRKPRGWPSPLRRSV